ncbi:MAG: glycosyltransferase family 2 protein [Clostridia bacterium]|nr:glycosyltransferase family 2 protein [Clostridia bacterium]
MTVSLCVVAYNEEKFLGRLLDNITKQTYPHELTEIVLINSMSTDNTIKIMNDFQNSDHDFKNVVIADNISRIQAAGWNEAIMSANEEVIVRIDAHAYMPPNFIENRMKNIELGEFVAGGPCSSIYENDDSWGNLLLKTDNSMFGSGINVCRRGIKKNYVNTMSHTAYRREVFAKVGGFNENLARTEDNEVHYRIRQAGYKLCFDPEAVSYQYARSSLKRMINQKFGNGYWIGLTLGVCPGCISVFHLVPCAFVLGIILTAFLSCFGIWQLASLMWGLYALFAVGNTVITAINDGFHLFTPVMPIIFLLLHVSYGLGTLKGIFEMPFKRKQLKACDRIEEVKEYVKKSLEIGCEENV